MTTGSHHDDDALRRSLEALDQVAERIDDGVELGDPDQIAGQLEELADDLVALMATSPETAIDGELDALIEECVMRVIADLQHPLQVETDTEPAAKMPSASREQAAAAITRAVALAAKHAGHGGQVRVTPMLDPAGAALRLAARCVETDTATLPAELHLQSLVEFVDQLGGRLTWSGTGTELELALHFA